MKNQEAKYKSLFAALDLSKNFYFSYTFDLTNTMQATMLHASSPGSLPVRGNRLSREREEEKEEAEEEDSCYRP